MKSLQSSNSKVFLPIILTTIVQLACLLLCHLLMAQTVCAQDTYYPDRELLKRAQQLFPGFGFGFDVLEKELDEFEEVVEIARELLEEHDSILDERGRAAASAWLKIIKLDHEIEQLIEESTVNRSNRKLQRKILHLIDAEISFDATELRTIDSREERKELQHELKERRRNRKRELVRFLDEIFEESGKVELAIADAQDTNDQRITPVHVGESDITAASNWNFDKTVKPVFVSTCFDCHSNSTDEGNLDLESLLAQTPLVKNRKRWENIVAQIENRTMPPPDSGEVSDDDRKTMAAWIRNRIERFDYTSVRNPGFESAKRLTHEEYNNTIRDLTGINFRPADRLPIELSGSSGFDNSSNSLFVHDALVEQYVGLAEHVVETAWPKTNRSTEQQQAWKRLFVAKPSDSVSTSDAASKIFAHWLPRVYRGSISRDDFDLMLKRFDRLHASGIDFETAVLKCVESTLMSPRFLLRVESTRSETDAFEIGPCEMANRLSFFLWASTPDDQLLELAKSGKFTDPQTIKTQVLRMIQDPKTNSLGHIFAGQWLGFEHLGTRIRLDPIDNPWCTDSLMSAMKSESALSFVYLIRENKRLHELIDADYTFLNDELAKFYRLPNVKGNEMRHFRLKTDKRGGIFGQGSLLAVTSFPERTSPVNRGTWILDNVLGKRPPSPPPNASQLAEEIEEREALTQRQKMQLHRRNPHCAACHNKIDPLGLALENYDLFGRYRTKHDGKLIDANAQLPDGTKFTGIEGLKRVIIERHLDDLLTQLTRKMLSYALGRQLEYYDEAAVQKITTAVRKDNYRIQTLVLEITKSYPFRYKQVQTANLESLTSLNSEQRHD